MNEREEKLKKEDYDKLQSNDGHESKEHSRSSNDIISQQISTENFKIYDTMRKGYAEMSRINLDICNEFEVCEKEVYAHF